MFYVPTDYLGDHSELDNVFVSDFNPPLVAKFTFEKNTATISSDNLEFWLNSHDQPLTLTSDTCGRSSVPMTESWPVSANLVKVEPQSNDCVKISAVNCGSPLKGNVEIRRKRLASDALELKFPHVPTSKVSLPTLTVNTLYCISSYLYGNFMLIMRGVKGRIFNILPKFTCTKVGNSH